MTCTHRCLWPCYARALQMLKHQSNAVGQNGKSHFWQKSETSAIVNTDHIPVQISKIQLRWGALWPYKELRHLSICQPAHLQHSSHIVIMHACMSLPMMYQRRKPLFTSSLRNHDHPFEYLQDHQRAAGVRRGDVCREGCSALRCHGQWHDPH